MIEVVKVGERARIEALVVGSAARIRRAFRLFLNEVRSEAVRRQVRIALEARGIEGALRVIDAHIIRLGGALTESFQVIGASEAAALARLVRRAGSGVAISFDPTWTRAAEIMRQNRLEFVRGLTAAQREVTRSALTEAFQSGASTAQTARAFRDSIGLTEVQRRAVSTYRSLLEAGDAAALDRALRDRRFDATVQRAAAGDEPIGAAQIARMVERYRERAVMYRTETIARTEALRVASLARQEALEQVLELAEIPRDSVVRTWRATPDARTRDTHADMDGQERGLAEMFESPSGARLMYPGDPAAPASEIINCRCVVLHDIRAA
jgi:hypothetical protein